jgi:hypothetical protein
MVFENKTVSLPANMQQALSAKASIVAIGFMELGIMQ